MQATQWSLVRNNGNRSVLKQNTHCKLHQAMPMQVPKLFGVGVVLLGGVVALGALCDTLLDIVVLPTG